MKKIIAAVLLSLFMACTPSQNLFFHPAAIRGILNDTCDVRMIRDLKLIHDSLGYWPFNDTLVLPDEVVTVDSCKFHLKKYYYPPAEDSAILLLTIRPYQMGRNEVVIGSLYSLNQNQDSIFSLERRIKTYTQKDEFENGTYMRFTYYIENDTSTIVKLGSMKY